MEISVYLLKRASAQTGLVWARACFLQIAGYFKGVPDAGQHAACLALIDKLIDLKDETEHMNGYANFAYGLRTGILLMFELFASENKRHSVNHTSKN